MSAVRSQPPSDDPGLAERHRELSERAEVLERTVKDLRAFIGCMAHDLRAPLHSISGFAGMLEAHDTTLMTQQGRRRLARIVACAAEMNQMIEDILACARSDASQLALQPVDVAGLVRALVSRLQDAYPASRVLVGTLPGIRADPPLVREVFANLIENALKFSSTREQAIVEIGAEGAREQPVFFVRDNGVGFPPELAGLLFAPFKRLHADAAYPGDGIGLSIVQHFLNRHGGWITAQSTPDHPATFRFAFGPHGKPDEAAPSARPGADAT